MVKSHQMRHPHFIHGSLINTHDVPQFALVTSPLFVTSSTNASTHLQLGESQPQQLTFEPNSSPITCFLILCADETFGLSSFDTLTTSRVRLQSPSQSDRPLSDSYLVNDYFPLPVGNCHSPILQEYK